MSFSEYCTESGGKALWDGYSMIAHILVVHPCDHIADREWRLTAAALHQERISYSGSLAWEEDTIQNSKYYFH